VDAEADDFDDAERVACDDRHHEKHAAEDVRPLRLHAREADD